MRFSQARRRSDALHSCSVEKLRFGRLVSEDACLTKGRLKSVEQEQETSMPRRHQLPEVTTTCSLLHPSSSLISLHSAYRLQSARESGGGASRAEPNRSNGPSCARRRSLHALRCDTASQMLRRANYVTGTHTRAHKANVRALMRSSQGTVRCGLSLMVHSWT